MEAFVTFAARIGVIMSGVAALRVLYMRPFHAEFQFLCRAKMRILCTRLNNSGTLVSDEDYPPDYGSCFLLAPVWQ
jgi:hypothetical protein